MSDHKFSLIFNVNRAGEMLPVIARLQEEYGDAVSHSTLSGATLFTTLEYDDDIETMPLSKIMAKMHIGFSVSFKSEDAALLFFIQHGGTKLW